MKFYIKLLTSLFVLFLSTQLYANEGGVGQQPDGSCCTECDDGGRGTAGEIPGGSTGDEVRTGGGAIEVD
jgi:hypothetical protein